MLSRLDAISAGVAHAAEAGAAGHDALARVEALAQEVEGLRAESVTTDNFDRLRAETSREITDVVDGLGRLTDQVAQAMASVAALAAGADSAFAAVRASEQHVDEGWTRCVCPSRRCTTT